jgi:hypothetical protein
MRYLALIVFALGAAAPATAAPQTDTGTLNATFNGLARLSLSTTTLTFPDADPDTVPQISPTQGPVTITAKARAAANGAVTLTVLAGDDLRSGVNTIPAANITWTATGAGFIPGTLSQTITRTVASWTGSDVWTGTQSFFFRNLWTYVTGTYTLTMTYTLTAP